MKLIWGDCIEELKLLEENSVDAVITDPPYELGFMGKKWDSTGIAYNVSMWKECLRVLKPGGHLLSFGGSRTYHRMACAIEDAGFEIRDQIMWVYGSGFPKSHNIGKAVDKLQGNERVVVGEYRVGGNALTPTSEKGGTYGVGVPNSPSGYLQHTKGTSEWEGWGTALKPAHEPICMARKPLSEKTVAENCLKWGVGGINIDGCRVEAKNGDRFGGGGLNSPVNGFMGNTENTYKKGTGFRDDSAKGRFPANLIHDGSDEVVGLFPESKSIQSMRGLQHSGRHGGLADIGGNIKSGTNSLRGHNDSGSASRFFYCAKASKKERNIGCEGLEEKRHADRNMDNGVGGDNPRNRTNTPKKNFHPTVKPLSLMKYLVRLITPHKGIVLDPFMGSGTTGMACKSEGFDFIGIEKEYEYFKIAKARIEAIKVENNLFD